MTRVWERLWVGGLDDAEALAQDNPDGIATVISFCNCPVRVKRWDVNYLHLPFEDGLPIPVRKFDAIIDAMAENVRWGRVLVHCTQGMSRAPSMAAAWMHVVGFKNIDAALDEIRRVRDFIWPSDILLESLRRHLQ
ncbi:MAG TPA: dual specificity protein phosphatase [Terracidiphilus sp.]|nr:dual specificity protein phosphatase [Terracidiphilus sp.]